MNVGENGSPSWDQLGRTLLQVNLLLSAPLIEVSASDYEIADESRSRIKVDILTSHKREIRRLVEGAYDHSVSDDVGVSATHSKGHRPQSTDGEGIPPIHPSMSKFHSVRHPIVVSSSHAEQLGTSSMDQAAQKSPSTEFTPKIAPTALEQSVEPPRNIQNMISRWDSSDEGKYPPSAFLIHLSMMISSKRAYASRTRY